MKEKLIKGLKYLKTNAITTTIVLVVLGGGTVLAANLASGTSETVVNNSTEVTTQVESAIAEETTQVIVEETTQEVTTVPETVAPVPKAVVQEIVTEAPTEAPIVNAPNANYFTYTMVGGGKSIYITGYNGNESNVIVPSTIDGFTVTGIADDTSGVFNGNTSITSITFPEGLTYLGACTCRATINLTSVSLPSTLTTIKHGSFLNCKSLKSISIPSSVTSIDNDNSIFTNGYISKDGKNIDTYSTLIVNNGSYAMQYAIEHNIPYSVK